MPRPPAGAAETATRSLRRGARPRSPAAQPPERGPLCQLDPAGRLPGPAWGSHAAAGAWARSQSQQELTEIHLRFYIVALPWSPPAPVCACDGGGRSDLFLIPWARQFLTEIHLCLSMALVTFPGRGGSWCSAGDQGAALAAARIRAPPTAAAPEYSAGTVTTALSWMCHLRITRTAVGKPGQVD
jgi:hypothetical protein